MIQTPLNNFDFDTIVTHLSLNQDFVWLDSADSFGCSILAFDSVETKSFHETDLNEFETFLRSFRFLHKDIPTPLFMGGWIGYFSYECFHFNPKIPLKLKHKTSAPLAIFKRYENFILLDHTSKSLTLYTETYQQRDRLIHRISTKMDLPAVSVSAELQNSEITFDKYQADFKAIKEDIASGRYFELNYSFELQARSQTKNFLTLYKKFRTLSASSMMAFLKFPEIQILSASPERFFKIEGNQISTFPIKGTIARGKSPVEDLDQKQKLLNSDKDRAELLMVTDMLRNDLGRICEYSSVTTKSLFDVVTVPYYHHLVSHITGTLSKNSDFFDVFQALFPGGSITGAPKISAMEQIQNLENRPRGVYTGAIGYISHNGTVDFNIAIRTLVINRDLLSFSVGSGLVQDSDCKSEYEECWLKASSFLDLLSSFKMIHKTAS